MLWIPLTILPSFHHGYLSTSESSLFSNRWKPQALNGHILSVSGISSFSKAKIAFSKKTVDGAFVQLDATGKTNLFLWRDTNKGNMTVVDCILWGCVGRDEQLLAFKKLHGWYDFTFPTGLLLPGDLTSDEEVLWWEATHD